jgi:enoyl-CoA hydratase/carnithine racemase
VSASPEIPATTALRVHADGPVASITLARPEKLNALDRATLEGLAAAAAWFDTRAEVKVVVVTGAGRAFSAGFDLTDRTWAELGPSEASARVGRAMAIAIGSMRPITIAAIRGHCIGGGVVLAAACDLRIASTTASFRIPEVDLGIPLYWTGIPRLVREMGPALTKELVLTGRSMDADEAKAVRFVNRVVADADLESATAALAAELASKPALVLETTKRQVEDAPALSTEADDLEGFARALRDPEGRAAASAYVARLDRR